MAQLSTVANGELAPNSSGGLTEGFGGRIGKVKAFFNQPSVQRALPTLAAVLLLPIGLFIYFAIIVNVYFENECFYISAQHIK